MPFPLPATPALSTPTASAYAPNFTAGPTGLDAYRSLRRAVLDGEAYFVNDYDEPRRWDRTNNAWSYLGSNAPSDFAALSLTGAPGTAILTGNTARYYLVGVNTTMNKETAPQTGSEVTIANSSGGTRDVVIPWTAGSLPVEYDKRRIYRALDGTDDFRRVAEVADAAATYTDTTPDSTLRTNGSISWNGSTRITRPGAMKGIVSAGNRLFMWNRTFGGLFYGELVRASDVSVVEDFRSLNVLPVGADDNTGPPTAYYSFHRADIIWKRRGIYEKTGSDSSTWEVLQLTTSRGAFNPKCVVPLDRRFIVLDELGVYEWQPGMYPGVLGTLKEMFIAPFQPLFDRMNLAASDSFHAMHLEQSGVIVFYVALDYEPQPNIGFVFDYGSNKFIGLITRRVPSATGRLDDADGARHPCFGDDLGWLYEDLIGNAEGATAGDTLAALTSGTSSTRALGASAAAFNSGINGPSGTPLTRVSSAGAIVDENRVYSNAATTLTTLLYPTTDYAASDFVGVGTIGGLFETAKLNFGTHAPKRIWGVWIECEYVPGATVRVDTALDDADFVFRLEPTLAGTNANDSSGKVRFFVPLEDYCVAWRLRISQRWAGQSVSIRTVTVQYEPRLGDIS